MAQIYKPRVSSAIGDDSETEDESDELIHKMRLSGLNVGYIGYVTSNNDIKTDNIKYNTGKLKLFGLLFVLISSALNSIEYPLMKLTENIQYNDIESILFTSALSVIFCGILLLFQKNFMYTGIKVYFYVLLNGIFGMFSVFSYYVIIKYTNNYIQNDILMSITIGYPVFIVLLTPFIFKKWVNISYFILSCFMVAGTILIIININGFNLDKNMFLNIKYYNEFNIIIYCMPGITLISQIILFISVKKVRNALPIMFIFITNFFILLCGIFIIFNFNNNYFIYNIYDWIFISINGIIKFTSQYFLIKSIQLLSVNISSILSLTQYFWLYLWIILLNNYDILSILKYNTLNQILLSLIGSSLIFILLILYCYNNINYNISLDYYDGLKRIKHHIILKTQPKHEFEEVNHENLDLSDDDDEPKNNAKLI